MEFSLPPPVEDYRRQIKQILLDNGFTDATGHPSADSRSLNRALAAKGLIRRAVPGLGDGDPIELWVLFNELEKAGAPFDPLAITVLVAAVVNQVGTQWQKDQLLPAIVAGEALACLGYSEPDAGSDIASVSTRAVRDGEQWTINGAKMFTSMAHDAQWVLLLTRTNPDVPKHKGLTMFVVPMDSPGITVKPILTMSDDCTNATFYEDVVLDHRWLLGDVDGGWQVMRIALAFERGVMGGTNPAVPLLRRLRLFGGGTGFLSDPLARQQVARVGIDNQVAALLTQRSAWIAASGGLPAVEGSMTKVFATEAYQKATAWFQGLAGAEGLLELHEPGAAAGGWIDHDARHSPLTTIAGGTTEINRNNIAEHGLGLPRTRR
jgi:alkylation response protein AidB-like acyl-CoA dehydrogenase